MKIKHRLLVLLIPLATTLALIAALSWNWLGKAREWVKAKDLSMDTLSSKASPWTLEYAVYGLPHPPSFSPLHSDFLLHQIYLEQLVGTLVKWGSGDRVEGFLAKRWETSQDKTQWTFELRPGLETETGETIDASSFRESLLRLFKMYLSQSDVPVFSGLKGWKDFKAGRSIDLLGLKADTKLNAVIFDFERPPSGGVLDMLGMPYLGFYSVNDFTPLSISQGKPEWKDNRVLTSSAMYRVVSYGEDEVILQKRQNPPIAFLPGSPERVRIQRTPDTIPLSAAHRKQLIVSKRLRKSEQGLELFRKIHGTPTYLYTLVISPTSHPELAQPAHREWIKNRVLEHVRENPFISEETKTAESFYAAFPTKNEPRTNQYEQRPDINRPLRLMAFANHSDETTYIQETVARALRAQGLQVEIIHPSFSKEELMLAFSEQRFDLRVASVEAGGAPENWVVNMMFCTKLGISFPDPSKRICELTRDVENGLSLTPSQYMDRMNNIIEDDASVIPLLHKGPAWLFSEDLDSSSMTPSMAAPRFDRIRRL